MCPVCVTTVVLIAGSVASMGGLAAVAMTKLGVKNAVTTEAADIACSQEARNDCPD